MNDEVFRECLSKFRFRGLDKPCKIGGSVVFSDGKVITIVPDNILDGTYETNSEYPDLGEFFNYIKTNKVQYEVDMESLYKELENIPKHSILEEKTKCKVCDGDGEIACSECGHMKECDRCEGTGEWVEEKKVEGDDYFDDNHFMCFKSDGYSFSMNHFIKIINMAKVMKDSLKINCLSDYKGSHFSVGDVHMFIMRRYSRGDADKNCVNHMVKIKEIG